MADILKETLKHYVDLDMYANYVIEAMMEEYNLSYAECAHILLSSDYYNTKTDYTLAYNAIKESVNEFSDKLSQRLEEEAKNVSQIETSFLEKMYKGILTVSAVSLTKTLFMPIDGRDTTKTFVERTKKNILRSYDTALRSGYIFGQSSSEVKQSADKALNQTVRGMKSGIETAIPSYAKSTDKIVFLQNNAEVTWVSTLDGRTCINCASLSGLTFKSITEAPFVPQHNLCRCILIPSSQVSGPVPDFEGFINSLEEDEQIHVLGKNRYELWKEYDIPLEKFLNNGEKIPLKELKESLGIDE